MKLNYKICAVIMPHVASYYYSHKKECTLGIRFTQTASSQRCLWWEPLAPYLQEGLQSLPMVFQIEGPHSFGGI